MLTLTACQTPSPMFSSADEAVGEINETAEDVKAEFCRGQAPQAITREQFDAWPQDAKDYAVANTEQWLAAGCKLEG